MKTMVAGDRLPKHLQDKVVEAYEIPLVGRVEIRQDTVTKQYQGWIAGLGVIHTEKPEDLTATRTFVGNFVCGVARRKHEEAKKAYQRISGPYSNLISTIGKSAVDGRSWISDYKR